MQEALAQKDKSLQEKDELVSGLTRALSELKQQLQKQSAGRQQSDCQISPEESSLPFTEVYSSFMRSFSVSLTKHSLLIDWLPDLGIARPPKNNKGCQLSMVSFCQVGFVSDWIGFISFH